MSNALHRKRIDASIDAHMLRGNAHAHRLFGLQITMTSSQVIRNETEVSTLWLTTLLGREVDSFSITPGHGNWSRQLAISARLKDGSTIALRLKICLGGDFGRSEVDYYTRDYVDMADAPLVR